MNQIVKKTSSFVLATGFALTAAATQAQDAPKSPWAGFVELAPSFNRSTPEGGTEDKNNVSSSLYVSGSYKASDAWTLGAEHLTGIDTLVAGESDFVLSHGYLRILASNKNVADFGGWKASVLYRWTVPTTSALQQQGGWGLFSVRPSVTKSFGSFSMLARNNVTVPLTDLAYQKNAPSVKNPKTKKVETNPAGINVLSNSLELFPAYNLVADTLDFTLYVGFLSKLKSAGKGQPANNTWGHTLEWESALAYTLPKNPALDAIAVSYYHASPIFLDGTDFKVASADGSYYNLKFQKSF